MKYCLIYNLRCCCYALSAFAYLSVCRCECIKINSEATIMNIFIFIDSRHQTMATTAEQRSIHQAETLGCSARRGDLLKKNSRGEILRYNQAKITWKLQIFLQLNIFSRSINLYNACSIEWNLILLFHYVISKHSFAKEVSFAFGILFFLYRKEMDVRLSPLTIGLRHGARSAHWHY